MSKPKSLVTGACGFIGTHMIEELAEAGHEIVATDLPAAWGDDDRARGTFPSIVRDLGATFVPADVRDRAALAAATRDLDYVFHVASVFNYSAPWELYHSVNVQGTRNLLELVHEGSPNLKRFVLWGAGGVYGLPQYQAGPLREDMPVAPPNDYLRSKWFQEHLTMRLCAEYGLSWAILRPTTVYGPRQAYGFGEALRSVVQAPVMAFPACLDGHVPLVHVRDVCGAALHLATDPRGEGIFNTNDDTLITTVEMMRLLVEGAGHRFVALPGLRSWMITGAARLVANVGELLRKVVPAMPPLVEGPTVDYLDADFLFDNSKLKAAGYEFRYPDGRVGLQESVAWYRDHGWI